MWRSGITQCVLYSILLVVAISIIPSAYAQANPSLKFDQPIIVTEHKDVITLFDTTDPVTIVTITSKNAAGTPIDTEIVTLLPVGSSGLYRQMVKFTLTTTPNPLELKVEAGGTVTVTGEGTLTDTAQITSGGESQSYGVRRYDNNYSTCAGSSDTDLDGVCANWETFTPSDLKINYPSGSSTYDVDCNSFLDSTIPCADPNVRDIYVEVDYMIGHRPNEEALRDVIAALGIAPAQGSIPPGIRLHIQLDDGDSNSIFHNACTKFPGLPAPDQGFDQLKAKFFGTPAERGQPGWDTLGWKQKKQVFHYVLFVHSQCGSTGSGTAEVFGNDAMITLGPFDGQIGSPDQQAGTFMHELGHNIKLHHGGAWNDSRNCKPNYMSVMSYSRQFSDLVNDRNLDYSRLALGTDVSPTADMLRESAIKESEGIEDYTPDISERITWGPTPPMAPIRTDQGCVNWDGDADTCESQPQTVQINTITGVGCTASTVEDLPGYFDWQNINLNSKSNGNWADGRSAEAGTEVAIWEGSSVDSEDMVPSTFCPPPAQILSVIPNSSNDMERQIHLDNYRNCAGGAGETDKTIICKAYFYDIITAITSLPKEHFKNSTEPKDLIISLNDIASTCLSDFSTVDTAFNSLLPAFDSEIINDTSLHPLKIYGKKLYGFDKVTTIDSSHIEITMEDVRDMRLSRVDSIKQFLNNLNDTNFVDKNAFLDTIYPKLDLVRDSITNDDMVTAVGILYNLSDDEIYDKIVNPVAKDNLKKGIEDIYISYSISYAVPEFGTLATLILVLSILPIILIVAKTKSSLIHNISNKN